MIALGLAGFPIAHSLSPLIHTAALMQSGLEGDYHLFSIPPDDRNGLKSLLMDVRSGKITGLNVTIPFKQSIIPLVDAATLSARAIGAVNTIYMDRDILTGTNTDAQGFLTDLKTKSGVLNRNGEKIALVLGAGGAARAVVFALVNDGWKIIISARRVVQARALADHFVDHADRLSIIPLAPRKSAPASAKTNAIRS